MKGALPLVLLAALPLTACGTAGTDGPSLLPRPVEEHGFAEPAAAPAPQATPDAGLDARIAALVARRREASTDFTAADRRVAASLAAGSRAAPGSDAWLDAQTAIGDLDSARATLLEVLTEFEQLAIARAAELAPPYPALETARVQTEAEVDRVSALVAERKAALPL